MTGLYNVLNKHVSNGSMVAIVLTQLEMGGPVTPAPVRDFWQYAAGA